jgi:hypothetical protein
LWVTSRYVNEVAEGCCGLFPDLEMKWQESSYGLFPDLEMKWQKVVMGYFQILK